MKTCSKPTGSWITTATCYDMNTFNLLYNAIKLLTFNQSISEFRFEIVEEQNNIHLFLSASCISGNLNKNNARIIADYINFIYDVSQNAGS